jgi:hypothetical protein
VIEATLLYLHLQLLGCPLRVRAAHPTKCAKQVV